MKEAQYILRSVTPISLIVFDELCKGTAIEEGASIAWAICEKLLNTTAFIFAATHYSYLTKLADLYHNVTKYAILLRMNLSINIFLFSVTEEYVSSFPFS